MLELKFLLNSKQSKVLMPRKALPRASNGMYVTLSILVLVICLFYRYAAVFQAPYPGFDWGADWTVNRVDPCQIGTEGCVSNQNTIQLGDQILVIGNLTFDSYSSNRIQVPFEGYELGDSVPVTFRRAGQVHTIAIGWQMLGPTTAAQLNRLIGLLLFLPFWLAGTAVLFLLRPHNLRWRLLVAFNYVTAAWVAAGVVSSLRVAFSSPAQHMLAWLLVPIYLHLHLTIPSPISSRLLRFFLLLLYAITAFLAILELFQALPGTAFNIGLLVAILGSFGLLLYHLRAHPLPADRIALRLMLVGIGGAFGPGILLVVLPQIFNLATGMLALLVAGLAIPLLPFFYTYAIYKRHLGNLEFRANRLLSNYTFILLYATAFVLAFSIGSQWLVDSTQYLAFSLLLSVTFMLAALPLRARYQHLFDRLAYGSVLEPDEILQVFANQIQTALERNALVRLLTREFMPSLLIRQSALCLWEEKEFTLFYDSGVTLDSQRESQALTELLDQSDHFLSPGTQEQNELDWVRLVIPLRVREKTVGAWLFGRRDPDDFYPQSDIALLQTLANQVATAIENMRLFEETRRRLVEMETVNRISTALRVA